jgi:IS605 OrfB family transposase
VSAIAFYGKCFGKRNLQKRLYYAIRERFALPANLAIRVIARVSQSYQTDRQKVHQFRARSLDLDKRLYTLVRTQDTLAVTIASCEGRIRLSLVLGAYQRTWLQHETREAKLIYRLQTKTFYLHVGIRFAVQPVPGTHPVGVDVGLNRLLVASNGFSKSGGTTTHERHRFRKYRTVLQRQGTSSAKRKLQRLANKETQWINSHLHQLTRQFVNSLRADEYVVLEDLTHIRQRAKQRKEYRNRFHAWAFAKLQALIAYKCAERGIAVVYVDPAYTSQRCPRCGTIAKRNRRSQALFRCVHCGFQHNADAVAATNLREQAQGIWAPVSAPIAAGDDPKGIPVQLRGSRAASSEVLARSN